jgi:spore maturation protein CgeB
MRVGVVGSTWPDDFADNILSSLTQMGHEAVPLGEATFRTSRSRWRPALSVLSRSVSVMERYQESVVRKAKQAEVQVVLSTQSELLPATVATLRAAGMRTALWFPDHVGLLDRQLMLVADYHAVFLKDPLLVARLRENVGSTIHYLPEACNPLWHRPWDLTDRIPALVVVGNLYPSRVRLLERLHKVGIPLRIHSFGWPRWIKGFDVQSLPVRPEVRRDVKARVFRNAAAVLNSLQPGEMASVNCRLFEATGSGAAVLCEHRPALDELYDPEHEVWGYRSFDELVDRARYALDHLDQGLSLGDSAASRAHSEHTYAHRLTRLLDVVQEAEDR